MSHIDADSIITIIKLTTMKKCLLLFMAICICHTAFAQATDLVVDCQTPGWLSSKINYGDQQTVQNLKVTGYINKTDMEFIGTLISSRSLNGELDLSECNIVGDTPSKDNILTDFHLEKECNIRVYRIPKSATKLERCLGSSSGHFLKVDSLYFDCQVKIINYDCFGGANYTRIGYLHLGENIDSIPKYAFDTHYKSVESVHLSPSTKYIGERSFNGAVPCNFNELNKLEVLEKNAFTYFNGTQLDCYYKPDTLIVPQSLKDPFYLFAFTYRDGQHIFIGDNIKKISGLAYTYGGLKDHYTSAKLIFHIDNVIPPTITNYKFSNDTYNLSTSIVYVPKGTKQAYLNSDWKNATIIELNPVENVILNEHSIVLNKGEQLKLSATVLPIDADDKTIEWISDNNSIASVDTEGNVTAIKEGQTKIIARSTATGIQDECTVLVRKNVEDISLNETEIALNNISDTWQLLAIITPNDATEKTVNWKSANEQVCTVSNSGLVTATGIGSTLVTATTVDGGLTATCVVKVLQHVDGLTLNKSTLTLKVGENEDLQATITPSNADNKNVLWSSANEQIATVSNEGNVAAVKAGEVIVTATSEDNPDVKATCKIIVVQPVTGINISESTCLLHGIGESAQLTATILPADASNKTIKWSSSNEGVCMVSNGTVVSTGFGTAVVIATTEDGGFMAYCTVTVESVTGIEEINADTQYDTNYFSPDGKRINTLQRGINIIRKKDGTIVKVIR